MLENKAIPPAHKARRCCRTITGSKPLAKIWLVTLSYPLSNIYVANLNQIGPALNLAKTWHTIMKPFLGI